jgi:hypothetical protein
MLKQWLMVLTTGVVFALASGPTLSGQGVEPNPTQIRQALEGGWSHSNLQPRGQPVIPVFEGWFRNEDGTYDLCFGYQNLNTVEVIDLPIGPDNFIEPSEFDGVQPTRFDPMPGAERQNPRRHYCVFTVTVPEDFGDRRVVWTLTSGGERAYVAGQRRDPTYSTPGHITSSHYELDEPDQRSPSDMEGAEGVVPSLSVAPIVRLGGLSDNVEARGRSGVNVSAGNVSVNSPLPLTVSVDPDTPAAWVWWNLHQGPASVQFDPAELRADEGNDGTFETTARFSTPGTYVLRMQAVSSVGELEFQCCWTNAYVHVEVEP